MSDSCRLSTKRISFLLRDIENFQFDRQKDIKNYQGVLKQDQLQQLERFKEQLVLALYYIEIIHDEHQSLKYMNFVIKALNDLKAAVKELDDLVYEKIDYAKFDKRERDFAENNDIVLTFFGIEHIFNNKLSFLMMALDRVNKKNDINFDFDKVNEICSDFSRYLQKMIETERNKHKKNNIFDQPVFYKQLALAGGVY